jgi:hypothetical protein
MDPSKLDSLMVLDKIQSVKRTHISLPPLPRREDPWLCMRANGFPEIFLTSIVIFAFLPLMNGKTQMTVTTLYAFQSKVKKTR